MRPLNNQRGSALLVAIFLMMMLTLLALSVADQTHTNMELSFNQVHADQAFYLAEAGAQRALAELNSDDTWRTGFADIAYGAGLFSVVVVDSNSDSTLADSIRIVSTGDVEQASASVALLLGPADLYPFRQALFGKSLVDMRNSFLTDSYNSDSGSYASTQLNSDGDVGSNGVIEAANGTLIGGSLATSLTGGLSINAGATVTGSMTDAAPPAEIPPIPQTEFDWAEVNNDNTTGINGSYVYDPVSYSFETSGTVELSTGVYYFSSIILKNSAELTIAPGASVTIYVTGDIELKNSSAMNSTGDPDDLLILSQGDFVLKNSGDMNAILYSPDGDADLRNSGDFYGAVVADNIYAHNSAGFHYDRNLRNRSLGKSERFTIVAWQELR